MNSRYNSFFQFLFTFIDLWGINMVYVVALFYFKSLPDILNDPGSYLSLYIVCNIAWMLSAAATSIYINTNSFRYSVLVKNTIETYLGFLFFVFVYTYFAPLSNSEYFVLSLLGGLAATLALSRLLYWIAGTAIRLHEKFVRKVVVIGYNDVAKNLVDQYLSGSKNISIEGFFEDYDKVSELSKYPIIGSPQDCLKYAVEHKISTIYSTLPAKDHPYLYEMAEQAENNFIRFKFAPDLQTGINKNVHVDLSDHIPIISLRREPLDDIANRIKKRLFDIVFSLFVIVFILSWLIPIIAILIKLDSKGPVFFIQNRLGRDLNKIRVFKFRSMRTTEADNQYKQATKDDPRITKLGRILRKTSLDELPQFFNVLLGNMSVVGPRPHPLKMNDDYKKIIDKYMIRHFLKPGITGWAQVNGFRGETKDLKDIKGRIEHDIWYMENWTPWLDLKIIFLTVYNVIKGEENAY